jgi:hypothetical protein
MELTQNIGLLIVLAVVGLLLPLCESRPEDNESVIFDADEVDDIVVH